MHLHVEFLPTRNTLVFFGRPDLWNLRLCYRCSRQTLNSVISMSGAHLLGQETYCPRVTSRRLNVSFLDVIRPFV